MKKKIIVVLLTLGLLPALINATFIDDELALNDMPNALATAYNQNQTNLKKYIRKLCLVLYNARNGIAYRDYSRKEHKYGREESHNLLLDISLVAKENGHANDVDNAAEYCSQIPNPETDYTTWSKDYAMDFKESAIIIRAIADELDWDPATTKTVIKVFWAKQRQLQKSRKGNQGQGKPK